MSTVFFAANPAKSSGFEALRHSHAAHPSRHSFAEDRSARNYQRELRGDSLPDGGFPIVMVCGENYLSRCNLIRALIMLKHGVKSPQSMIPGSENMFRAFITAAQEDGDSYVWFLAEHFHSHALAVLAAQNPRMRIYCSAPKPDMSASITRLSRVIQLSPAA